MGMRHGASLGGNGDEQEKGVQTDLVLCSELNSELVKSNYVPVWGLDPVNPGLFLGWAAADGQRGAPAQELVL